MGRSCIVLGKAAQLGFHPGDELQRPEGFGDIIIRAQRQSGDFVDLFIPGGQHDDGKVVGLPDFLTDGKAADIRKHHIQDGQIRSLLLQKGQDLRSVVKFVYLVGFVFQI